MASLSFPFVSTAVCVTNFGHIPHLLPNFSKTSWENLDVGHVDNCSFVRDIVEALSFRSFNPQLACKFNNYSSEPVEAPVISSNSIFRFFPHEAAKGVDLTSTF